MRNVSLKTRWWGGAAGWRLVSLLLTSACTGAAAIFRPCCNANATRGADVLLAKVEALEERMTNIVEDLAYLCAEAAVDRR
jgi:hypothetical protein